MRKLKTSELKRINPHEFRNAEALPVTVVLDDVRSAYNTGSIFRTCDAFRVSEIILCGITAQPPNRELMKTAIGSTESVRWKYEKEIAGAIRSLQTKGIRIVLIEQTDQSIPLQEFFPDREDRYALVFGNEIEGVNESILSLADQAIEIPQFGTKHSFNVSVTAGILLWDFFLKLKSTK